MAKLPDRANPMLRFAGKMAEAWIRAGYDNRLRPLVEMAKQLYFLPPELRRLWREHPEFFDHQNNVQ